MRRWARRIMDQWRQERQEARARARTQALIDENRRLLAELDRLIEAAQAEQAEPRP